MKLEVYSTDRIELLGEQPCRVWNGRTPAGHCVVLFVAALGASVEAVAEMEAACRTGELLGIRRPNDLSPWPHLTDDMFAPSPVEPKDPPPSTVVDPAPDPDHPGTYIV